MLKMTGKRATLERLIAIHDQYESLRDEERELLGTLSTEDAAVKGPPIPPVLGPALPPVLSSRSAGVRLGDGSKAAIHAPKKAGKKSQKGPRKSKGLLSRIVENMPSPQTIEQITARLGLLPNSQSLQRVRREVYRNLAAKDPLIQRVSGTKPVKFELKLPSSGRPLLPRLQVG